MKYKGMKISLSDYIKWLRHRQAEKREEEENRKEFERVFCDTEDDPSIGGNNGN